MENLIIKRENNTPKIEFRTDGELHIEGRSVPENPIGFFEPIINWVDDFRLQSPKKVNLYVYLEYFNSGTSKLLLKLLKQMERMRYSGTDVNLYWYYNENDQDILEAGQDYETIVKLPFRFIERV
jgi:hypothetical protein